VLQLEALATEECTPQYFVSVVTPSTWVSTSLAPSFAVQVLLPRPKAGAGVLVVGLAGFEPTTSSSRTKRATKLRYSPQGEVTLSDDPGGDESRCSDLSSEISGLARHDVDEVGVGVAGQEGIGSLAQTQRIKRLNQIAVGIAALHLEHVMGPIKQ
jgi:hypothetical protein